MQDLVSAVVAHCPPPPHHPIAAYSNVFPSSFVPGTRYSYRNANRYLLDPEDDPSYYGNDWDEGPSPLVEFVQYRLRIAHPVRMFVIECGFQSTRVHSELDSISEWKHVATFTYSEVAITVLNNILQATLHSNYSEGHDHVSLFCGDLFCGRYDLNTFALKHCLDNIMM